MREITNRTLELGELLEIAEDAYGILTDPIIGTIRSADKIFVSDSGDSMVTYHHIHDGKYQAHTFSRVGGRDVVKMTTHVIDYMFSLEECKSIWFFCKDKRARLLIGSQAKKYINRTITVDLEDNERLYILYRG